MGAARGGPWADYERAGVAKLQGDTASGREVYTISDAQLGEWRKAAEPVTKVWADGARKAGVDPDAVLAELKASLAKYNAAAIAGEPRASAPHGCAGRTPGRRPAQHCYAGRAFDGSDSVP